VIEPSTDPSVAGVPPLPVWVRRSLTVGIVVSLLVAGVLALGMSTLRQRRLLDAAQTVAVQRTTEAKRRLSRAGEAKATLAARHEEAEELNVLLLGAEDDAPVRATLEFLVDVAGLEQQELRLGTVRRGDILGTVAGTLGVRGSREDLPPLLAAFYGQQRVVRLTSLELRDDDGGDLLATLRWDYAAPSPPLESDAPSFDLAPPRVAAVGSLLAVDAVNRSRWEALDNAARTLRSLAPAVQDLAAIDAEVDWLDRRRRALARWQAASKSEARSVQRKLPAAFRMLDVSAVGRAVLRPGPGGALQVDEGG
jgi:hypothetical protein